MDSRNTTDGTKIENWQCNGGGAQVWQLRADSSLYNPNSGKCADVTGAGTANNTLVQLYTCNGTNAQVWQVQADGTLKNPNSGRCLDGGGSAPAVGTQVYIYDCSASVGQWWVANLTDADGLQGRVREQITYDGSQVIGSTIHVPTVTQTALRSTPNPVGQDIAALMVTETDTKTRTWLPATSTWRWTELQTSYNGYGLPTVVKDLADTSISTDDTCATTTYATADTAKWLIDYPANTITTDCAASPGDADYLKGTQTYYDGSTVNGATPTQGLVTRTNDLASVSAGVLTWKQSARSGYDANGRVTSSYDALDHLTATAFTPTSGGPVTAVTVTNPLNFATTTTVEPGKGLTMSTVDIGGKTTTEQYDPLGRLTEVWLHNRASALVPDLQYTYALAKSTVAARRTLRLLSSDSDSRRDCVSWPTARLDPPRRREQVPSYTNKRDGLQSLNSPVRSSSPISTGSGHRSRTAARTRTTTCWPRSASTSSRPSAVRTFPAAITPVSGAGI
jgi:Ricin-type beta-trefoil lectin domain-like